MKYIFQCSDCAAIAYITSGDKTINGLHVNSYACRAYSAGASEGFRAVRDMETGRTQVLTYHLIQSFAPDEITPEQTMQIGEELCDRYLKGDYQYVIAVHNDKDHLHCHVIFNNTNLYNGLSFTIEHNQGRKNERAWAELRQISDEICTLGDEFEPEAITEMIENVQGKAEAAEQIEKCFAARRASRHVELDLLNQSSAKPADPKPTSTAPTESQAPEKKEDVWASIRGMHDCDKMIADLEAGGIMSFSELSGFFFNTHHADDHTDELVTLDKKIRGIDKLIKMMKQRYQHSATYKEYQERSAFTQKSFRKKNAAAIEAYEEADKYIKEHIKNYLVDVKTPKRSELEQWLIELKSKYNSLVHEHNAFITRQDTALKYT